MAYSDLGSMYPAVIGPTEHLHSCCHLAYTCPGVKEMLPHHHHLLVQSEGAIADEINDKR